MIAIIDNGSGPSSSDFDAANAAHSKMVFPLKEIAARVGCYYGVDGEWLRSDRRMEPLATVRGIAMLLAREAGMKDCNIARYFNRSHGIVRQRVESLRKRLLTDEALRADVVFLRRQGAGAQSAGRVNDSRLNGGVAGIPSSAAVQHLLSEVEGMRESERPKVTFASVLGERQAWAWRLLKRGRKPLAGGVVLPPGLGRGYTARPPEGKMGLTYAKAQRCECGKLYTKGKNGCPDCRAMESVHTHTRNRNPQVEVNRKYVEVYTTTSSGWKTEVPGRV